MKQKQEDSGTLFDAEELDKLQKQLQKNYQKEFDKKKFVFVEDKDDFADIPEDTKTRGVLCQDLIDVTPILNQIAENKAKELEKAVKEAYKTMDLPYFENPKTHNEKLLNYQHDYIKNNDINAYAKLIELSFDVCKFLVWRYLRDHRDIYLDEISQEEKASIAMEYVIRRYKYNVGWYARTNFIGVLKGGVRHAMEYQNTTDENTIIVEEPRLERVKNTKKKNN